MADIKIICRRDQWQVKMKEVIARDRLFLYKDMFGIYNFCSQREF